MQTLMNIHKPAISAEHPKIYYSTNTLQNKTGTYYAEYSGEHSFNNVNLLPNTAEQRHAKS